MGKVSIWAQALGVAIGVLLSSAFVVLFGWFIGWSHFRRLWPRRKVAPGAARGLGQVLGAVEVRNNGLSDRTPAKAAGSPPAGGGTAHRTTRPATWVGARDPALAPADQITEREPDQASQQQCCERLLCGILADVLS